MDSNNLILTAFLTIAPILMLKYKGFLKKEKKTSFAIAIIWSLLVIALSPLLLEMLKYQISWKTIIPTALIFGGFNIFVVKDDISLRYLPKMFIVVALFFCSSLFQYIPVKLFGLTAETVTPTIQGYLTLFSNLCFLITLFLIYWKDLKEHFLDLKKNFNSIFDTSLKYWMVGLFVMIGSNVLISLFAPQSIAGNEQSVQKMLEQAPLITFLCAGIIAPFIEELVFRKSFFDTFKSKWLFVLTSGIVFGSLHVIFSMSSLWDFLYVIPYSALGISFSYMLYKTKNIFSPIMMHLIHNVMLTSLSILTAMVMIP